MHHELSISGSVVQVSGLISSEKLYLAVASDLCSTLKSFCVDDKYPTTITPFEIFPKFNDWSNTNIVYYPHHERVYITSHSGFQCLSPTNNLSVVDTSTGEEKCLTERRGYPSDLVVDGYVRPCLRLLHGFY